MSCFHRNVTIVRTVSTLCALALVGASPVVWRAGEEEERLIGEGVEPSVASNYADQQELFQVIAYMQPDNVGIDCVYSLDGGDTWDETNPFTIDANSWADPTLVGHTAAKQVVATYIGQAANDYRLSSRRTEDGENGLSVQAVQTHMPAIDRPWLATSPDRAYCSFFQLQSGPTQYFSKIHCRVAEIDGAAVDWANSTATEVSVINAGNPFYDLHAPIAVGNFEDENRRAYILALHYFGNQTDPSSGDNAFLCFRTSDGGSTWTESTVVVLDDNYPKGYYSNRDQKMTAHHVSADPGNADVFAFYVRTVQDVEEMGSFTLTRQQLCTKRSTDGGETWGSEVVVATYTGQQTYATVPGPSGPTTGFFRIGRVWSCLAPDGTLHVVRFDNREGAWGDGRDKWRVRRAWSEDKGSTWTVDSSPVSGDYSVGGYACPDTSPHLPPGDFLACVADVAGLHVVWPDSRAWHTEDDDVPRIYYRRYAPLMRPVPKWA